MTPTQLPQQPVRPRDGQAGQKAAQGPADSLLRASVRQLASYPSVETKIRQQIAMYGQQVNGAGSYYQWGRGDQLRLRLELRIPLGKQQIASLQHVCDGRHLWMRKAVGEKVQLQRVDLSRVRAVSGPDWRPGWRNAIAGGLPRLLDSLATDFQFGKPVETVWQKQRVWRLRAAIRAPFKAEHKLNSELPSHIEVILDHASLFPLRISYFAAHGDGKSGQQMRLLMATEFYGVRIGQPIDSSRFTYEAENYRNATEEFIATLKNDSAGAQGSP